MKTLLFTILLVFIAYAFGAHIESGLHNKWDKVLSNKKAFIGYSTKVQFKKPFPTVPVVVLDIETKNRTSVVYYEPMLTEVNEKGFSAFVPRSSEDTNFMLHWVATENANTSKIVALKTPILNYITKVTIPTGTPIVTLQSNIPLPTIMKTVSRVNDNTLEARLFRNNMLISSKLNDIIKNNKLLFNILSTQIGFDAKIATGSVPLYVELSKQSKASKIVEIPKPIEKGVKVLSADDAAEACATQCTTPEDCAKDFCILHKCCSRTANCQEDCRTPEDCKKAFCIRSGCCPTCKTECKTLHDCKYKPFCLANGCCKQSCRTECRTPADCAKEWCIQHECCPTCQNQCKSPMDCLKPFCLQQNCCIKRTCQTECKTSTDCLKPFCKLHTCCAKRTCKSECQKPYDCYKPYCLQHRCCRQMNCYTECKTPQDCTTNPFCKWFECCYKQGNSKTNTQSLFYSGWPYYNFYNQYYHWWNRPTASYLGYRSCATECVMPTDCYKPYCARMSCCTQPKYQTCSVCPGHLCGHPPIPNRRTDTVKNTPVIVNVVTRQNVSLDDENTQCPGPYCDIPYDYLYGDVEYVLAADLPKKIPKSLQKKIVPKRKSVVKKPKQTLAKLGSKKVKPKAVKVKPKRKTRIVFVDLAHLNLTKTPIIIASLVSQNNIAVPLGMHNIFGASEKGFYVILKDLPKGEGKKGLSINWIIVKQ